MGMYNPNQYPAGQYQTSQYPPSGMSARRTLRRVGVGSAFKVMAVLSGLIWIIFGLFFGLLALCGVLGSIGSLRSGTTFGSGINGGSGVLAAGGVTLIIVYIVGAIFYAIVGGIIGALYALLYNATARLTGGLEVDIS